MKYTINFSIFALFFTLQVVSASNPTLTSYEVSPASASSGQLISLNWSAQDSQGASLVVSCVPGVKVKKQDGSLFPCDTKTTLSSQASDSLGFFVSNTSGSYKIVTFTLYPKDASGADTSVGQSRSLSVATMPYPITSFFTSATSTTSGASTTLSWGSAELDGVNLSIQCVDGVTVFESGSPSVLPCGQVAFSSKRSPTGSISLVFKNRNMFAQSVRVSLLPYISDSSYDQTHAESIEFDVASEKIMPAQILNFVATPPAVASDDNLVLLWSTLHTNAVTLQMSCVEGVSALWVTSTTTAPLPCGKVLSDTGYAPNSSSTTVSLLNTTNDVKTVTFTLYPQLAGGGFDGIYTKRVSVMVYPKGRLPEKAPTNTFLTQATASTKTITSSQKFVFSRLLKLGTRNTDVTELQKILAQDKSVYPEGSVTGYFGPATQRAIGRFQVKHNITNVGQPGYGQVGPKTREKLNSM